MSFLRGRLVTQRELISVITVPMYMLTSAAPAAPGKELACSV